MIAAKMFGISPSREVIPFLQALVEKFYSSPLDIKLLVYGHVYLLQMGRSLVRNFN